MAAKHRTVITLTEPGPVFFARVVEAFRRLGWKVSNYQPNLVHGSKGMDLMTWGENFYLNQISENQVEVICENPMALFDPFGILKRRSRKLLNMIDSVPPPDQLPQVPPTPPMPS